MVTSPRSGVTVRRVSEGAGRSGWSGTCGSLPFGAGLRKLREAVVEHDAARDRDVQAAGARDLHEEVALGPHALRQPAVLAAQHVDRALRVLEERQRFRARVLLDADEQTVARVRQLLPSLHLEERDVLPRLDRVAGLPRVSLPDR